MKITTIGLAILTAIVTTSVFASGKQEMSAGTLLEFCSSKDASVNAACRFYILGVAQGFSIGSGSVFDKGGSIVGPTNNNFCIPQDISGASLVRIFITTAHADFAKYPDDQDSPAVSIVVAALIHSFPCQ
jgi:hypothetical protein